MSSITTGDGCRLAFRFDPPSSRPVLVLSNSLGTAMDMWRAQISAFSAHFRVLQYDSRGHGRSDAPPGAYSLDRSGVYLPYGLPVLTFHEERIDEIHVFHDPTAPERFGLPAQL